MTSPDRFGLRRIGISRALPFPVDSGWSEREVADALAWIEYDEEERLRAKVVAALEKIETDWVARQGHSFYEDDHDGRERRERSRGLQSLSKGERYRG